MSDRLSSTKSGVVRMPKLYCATAPECLIWFENGMIWIEDQDDTANVIKVTVDEFTERLNVIRDYVLDFGNNKLICGKAKALSFVEDAENLIARSKGQLHVGMPLDVIADESLRRSAKTCRSGFGNSSGKIIVNEAPSNAISAYAGLILN